MHVKLTRELWCIEILWSGIIRIKSIRIITNCVQVLQGGIHRERDHHRSGWGVEAVRVQRASNLLPPHHRSLPGLLPEHGRCHVCMCNVLTVQVHPANGPLLVMAAPAPRTLTAGARCVCVCSNSAVTFCKWTTTGHCAARTPQSVFFFLWSEAFLLNIPRSPDMLI